jgi:7-cyano-7-deazaguanine synthase
MTNGAVPDSALVLFSGGQDSATCLAWALARYARVETIGFAYGQRHAIELQCRAPVRAGIAAMRDWGDRLGEDHVIDLSGAMAAVGATALTSDAAIVMTEAGLPSTFVPGRNLLFLTCAASVAYRRGLRRIVGGMCETDYSGYPDCRDDTIKAMQVALTLGLDRRFVLETPLMWIDKAATWEMAAELGGAALVDLIVAETHTCYLGDRTNRHPWGWGCGGCPACELRAQGWEKFQARSDTNPEPLYQRGKTPTLGPPPPPSPPERGGGKEGTESPSPCGRG